MNEVQELDTGRNEPSRSPNRTYIIAAAVLVVVIIVAVVLLVTYGIPALKGTEEPTAATEAEPSVTQVPTSAPGPAAEPTDTPSPVLPPLVMADTDTPAFDYDGAGARPGLEWTGFFGQVVDADGNPLPGVPVIVWYRDGQPAADPIPTDQDGNYQIVLADAPLAGTWTIQLLTEDGQPASKLFTFETNENTETGIQQIQVLWKQKP